ncbi:MAG TPA: PqqD family protein [Bacteroidales bacterium]|nr:PqqD family protein [Bacteroidales bacterium]
MARDPRNFLDMVPVRNITEFTRDGDEITLLLPKFKSAWMRKWLIPPRRSAHIKIHLDTMGSKVWDLIDGIRNTGEICERMNPGSAEPAEPMEKRVTEFLRQLYKNRFILFK